VAQQLLLEKGREDEEVLNLVTAGHQKTDVGPQIWKENERKDQKITEDDRKKSGPACFHV